jgi:hypothetical protein
MAAGRSKPSLCPTFAPLRLCVRFFCFLMRTTTLQARRSFSETDRRALSRRSAIGSFLLTGSCDLLGGSTRCYRSGLFLKLFIETLQ